MAFRRSSVDISLCKEIETEGGSKPLTCLLVLQFDNEKCEGSPSSFFSYRHFKLKQRVSLTGYNVTMVSCYTMTVTITCSTITRHLFDTIIVESTDKEFSVLINQIISDGKCGELLRATLKHLACPNDVEFTNCYSVM